jgi:transmembrane sensor
LADGKNVNIDSISTVIKQSNAFIQFSGNSITYIPKKSSSQREYNTLTTSFGKQSIIILPDGSKVWMNACSSILYPTAFNNETRKVQLIGEAFFEISTIIDSTRPGMKVPFIVELKNGSYINVTGTKFNINAYLHSDIKATLIEGGIEVQKDNFIRKILPGEQAVINSSGNVSIDRTRDVTETFSWKDGMFNYNDTPIEQVMADISRWYNVKIEYKQYVSNHLTIKVPRGITLTNLLNLLQMNSAVHFEINGKKVIVSN